MWLTYFKYSPPAHADRDRDHAPLRLGPLRDGRAAPRDDAGLQGIDLLVDPLGEDRLGDLLGQTPGEFGLDDILDPKGRDAPTLEGPRMSPASRREGRPDVGRELGEAKDAHVAPAGAVSARRVFPRRVVERIFAVADLGEDLLGLFGRFDGDLGDGEEAVFAPRSRNLASIFSVVATRDRTPARTRERSMWDSNSAMPHPRAPRKFSASSEVEGPPRGGSRRRRPGGLRRNANPGVDRRARDGGVMATCPMIAGSCPEIQKMPDDVVRVDRCPSMTPMIPMDPSLKRIFSILVSPFRDVNLRRAEPLPRRVEARPRCARRPARAVTPPRLREADLGVRHIEDRGRPPSSAVS